MTFVAPFSCKFWACYFCGGLSDVLDGFVARKLKQQSTAGAKLDSIADLTFAIAIFIVIIKNIHISKLIWQFIILIILLRGASYSIVYYKYHTFAALHTYANKATGILIFVFPLLYILLDITITEIILCVIALISSLEELVIIIKSKELNLNCKSIFIKKSKYDY